MPRPCTVCGHAKRAEIDERLLNGTAIRDIAGQYALAKSAVDRHRSHMGTLLAEAGQRRAELEVDLGDNLLDQARALTKDLSAALEEAKQAKSLSAFLQVADRLQKQLALQAQLLERAHVVGGENRFIISWAYCPHHPDGDCRVDTHARLAEETGTPDPEATPLN